MERKILQHVWQDNVSSRFELVTCQCPQRNVMDLANLLDETADVFIFKPGCTADALVLRLRLHNATVCSLACFTIIMQDVADDGQKVFCVCWQCLHQLSQILDATLHCNCALWKNEVHINRFLGLFNHNSISIVTNYMRVKNNLI